MNNREEAYITFCKSHDGNWSARDLFNGGYQAGLASQPAQLSSNPLQLPAQAQQPTQEPIYQLKMNNGSWIDQERGSYEYNVKNGHETRIVYAAMQSQAQQESLVTRKAFICPACEGVDADSPVSSCHCMENDSNTFIEGTITYRIPPAPEGGNK